MLTIKYFIDLFERIRLDVISYQSKLVYIPQITYITFKISFYIPCNCSIKPSFVPEVDRQAIKLSCEVFKRFLIFLRVKSILKD